MKKVKALKNDSLSYFCKGDIVKAKIADPVCYPSIYRIYSNKGNCLRHKKDFKEVL